ncbi:MAG: hypothetical protein ACK44W_05970, partial [Planctomycetota bacterium]
MPTFTVEAIDAKGKRIRADVDASSANEAIAKVKQKGYKPMNVKEKATAPPAVPPGPAPGTPPGGT